MLAIHLSKNLQCSIDFQENHSPKGEAVGVDQLPEKFKTEFKTQLNNFEKQGQ
jgi:hypothetical protein